MTPEPGRHHATGLFTRGPYVRSRVRRSLLFPSGPQLAPPALPLPSGCGFGQSYTSEHRHKHGHTLSHPFHLQLQAEI